MREKSKAKRMLAVIVFSDIVNYSGLVGQDEVRTLNLAARDLGMLRKCCERYDGEVVKSTGDGVNIASRLQEIAPDGGICVSQAVYDTMKNAIAFGHKKIGPKSLKHIKGKVSVYEIFNDTPSDLDSNDTATMLIPVDLQSAMEEVSPAKKKKLVNPYVLALILFMSTTLVAVATFVILVVVIGVGKNQTPVLNPPPEREPAAANVGHNGEEPGIDEFEAMSPSTPKDGEDTSADDLESNDENASEPGTTGQPKVSNKPPKAKDVITDGTKRERSMMIDNMLTKVFASIDTNKDGKVNEIELDNKDAKLVVNFFDVDGDGELNEDEFNMALEAKLEEEMDKAIEQMDTNKDGKLQTEEGGTLRYMRLINHSDTDDNGVINGKEIEKFESGLKFHIISDFFRKKKPRQRRN